MEIKFIDIVKWYGHVIALDRTNLQISEGIHGLLGANGAGKTTFLRLLCSVLYPTEGEITLDGRNIDNTAEVIKKNIHMI